MKLARFLFFTLILFCVSSIDAQAEESSGIRVDLEVNTPTVSTSTPPSGSDPESRYFLSNLFILTDKNSALISWISSQPAMSKISWGLTEDYEMGILAEVSYFKAHASKIANLQPNTRYFFKIESIASNGVRFADFRSSFITSSYAVSATTNVTNLSAISSGDSVKLAWTNPTKSFDSIRIVKSDTKFPADYLDGQVVYEGRGNYFYDNNVIDGKTYYYAVFVNVANQYSSGSLVSIRYTQDDFSVSLPPDVYEGDIGEYGQLDISDFDFIQFDKKISFIQDGVIVTSGEDITLILQTENIPPELLEKLGYLVVVIPSPVKNFFYNRYLTKLSEDFKFYEAVIPAFLENGIYPFYIEIYGLDGRLLDKVTANFVVINASEGDVIVGIDKSDVGLVKDLILWLIIILILIALQRRLSRNKGSNFSKAEQ